MDTGASTPRRPFTATAPRLRRPSANTTSISPGCAILVVTVQIAAPKPANTENEMPRHLNKSLVVELWPLAHRRAWNGAREQGDVLRDGGAASHWRASTARTVSRSYGHLLVWSAEHGLLAGQADPAD